MKMYYIVRSYEVAADKVTLFEEVYSPSGAWFHFFEKCEDFLGLELIKNTSEGTYLLIDKWISKETYDDFLQHEQATYDQLNAQYRELYTNERLLGTYETVNA